jgi:hypothetical protein
MFGDVTPGAAEARCVPCHAAAVIDTLVARVQGVPGEDMCVMLLGYDDPMRKMLREANPGLSRRFQLEEAFYFEDYTNDQLLMMLLSMARKNGWMAGVYTRPLFSSSSAVIITVRLTPASASSRKCLG